MPPPFNGQSIAFKALIKHLTKANIPYQIINISGNFTTSSKQWTVIKRGIDYISILVTLFLKCLSGKNILYVQVAQSRNGFRRDVWINRIAQLFDSKIIGHLHGGNFNGFYEAQDQQTKDLIKKELLKYSKIIVLSNNLKRMYDFQPIIHDRIISIPNGIDMPINLPPKNIDSARPINILYISTLIESKGYLVVLESLLLLKKSNIHFKATFCGEFDISNDQTRFINLEEARENFFNKIKEYNLENEVRYNGVVTGTKKENLFAAAHFFVLPTQYINEGQPISIIEAMRTGCVVISSNYRAIPEMINHGITGFLLDDILPLEIANLIIYCKNNSEAFSAISKNATEYYNTHFTEAVHGQKMIELLQHYSNMD